jgi:hypothetical protein
MSQVGHADAETTMRIYSQLLKRAKRAHGRAFDSLVADARETVLGGHEGHTETSENTSRPAPNWHTNWHKSPKQGLDAALAEWSEGRKFRGLAGVSSARPAGFEPATSRSGGERSIH